MNDVIQARRKLGTGPYDRKLMARMVQLSVADNYEEASTEWVATGNCYWGSDEIPDWWETPNRCLCGHDIVYHFEVENTENGNMIIVGSDHINTYQIIRELMMSRSLTEEMITEEMIQEWLDVRVAAMKKTAWWKKNGSLFTRMFDAVKDYDVRVNVNVKKWQFDPKYGRQMPITTLRKRSSGHPDEIDTYKMASIVWRWNHPDNSRAQINSKRGFPNEKLFQDLIMFFAFLEKHKEYCDNEDKKLAQLEFLNRQKDIDNQQRFEGWCEYYAIPIFDPEDYKDNNWEYRFLSDIKRRLTQGYEIFGNTSKKLLEVLERKDVPATEKQIKFMINLGINEETANKVTKKQASKMIDEKIKERNEQ